MEMVQITGDDDAVDRLVDAIESMAEQVGEFREHVRGDLRGLQDAIDELQEQLQWAWNNVLPEFQLWNMAANPLDPQWGQKLNREILRLACTGCDCPPPATLEDALKAGWSELMHDGEQPDWEYLGLCPNCVTVRQSHN